MGIILIAGYLIVAAALVLQCAWQDPYGGSNSGVQCFIGALAWPLIALVLAAAFGLTFTARAAAGLAARHRGGGR